jgi:hypothetical protein
MAGLADEESARYKDLGAHIHDRSNLATQDLV